MDLKNESGDEDRDEGEDKRHDHKERDNITAVPHDACFLLVCECEVVDDSNHCAAEERAY